MLNRLDYEESENASDVRRRFDNELGVTGWRTPMHPIPPELPPEESGAPDWWHGAEEASQAWLVAQGVVLDAG
jgi:hypothetical protein